MCCGGVWRNTNRAAILRLGHLAWRSTSCGTSALSNSDCRVKFDEQLLTAVATEAENIREELDLAQAAVLDCVNELPPGDRDLLRRRYEAGATIKAVAAAVGRSTEGLYKTMRRIHTTLHDCVQRRLKSEGIHVRQS